jgi:predicted nucleic acid-binding Zn ribbon protein
MPVYEYRCQKCGENFQRAEHVTEQVNGSLSSSVAGPNALHDFLSCHRAA